MGLMMNTKPEFRLEGLAIGLIWTALMIFMALANPVRAGQLSLRQERDGASPRALSTEELASLQDPFFRFVLREHAEESNLARIEELIQPDADHRHVFIVDERIADPSRGQSRRSVIAFSGRNPDSPEELTGNVMLSVFFNSDQFPDQLTFAEAWGWDESRGRYNYYKLDSIGATTGGLIWKFRGSSVGAAAMTPAARVGTCMQCHTNGEPMMKELAFPWNNWHSFKDQAEYLLPTAPTSVRWPVASSTRLERLDDAAMLETAFIVPSLRRFAGHVIRSFFVTVDSSATPDMDPQGRVLVRNGANLLLPLFTTTQFNLISSSQASGLHPLGSTGSAAPTQDVTVPAMFFLNSDLLAGGGAAGLRGLGLTESRDFGGLARLTPAEYTGLVTGAGLRLRDMPGDANFAWLTPVASQIDNVLVDELVAQGVVTREFVAAVLAVDLETPMLSTARESLLRLIPDSFRFTLADGGTPATHPDGLTLAVVERLLDLGPGLSEVEKDFLTLLRSNDPVAVLRQRVASFADRTRTRLADPQERQQELERLFGVLGSRRNAVISHPVFRFQDETRGLLLPSHSAGGN